MWELDYNAEWVSFSIIFSILFSRDVSDTDIH